MKGTEIIVKALKEEGVDTIFGYPGGQAVDIFDALYGEQEIEVILPRHEQALSIRQTAMQGLLERWESVLLQVVLVRQIW